MGMRLLVVKGGTTYDMTALVNKVVWSGRKSSIARSLTIDMLDSDRHGHDRPDIDVTQGHQCAFYWNNEELFRGIIMFSSQKNDRIASYKAYDNAIYLAKNNSTFVYKKKTGSQIFSDICGKFSVPCSAVDTGYVITDLTMPNTSCADAIWSALATTYAATGQRYYVLSQKGTVRLIQRASNMVQWVIEEGVNTISYTRSRSIEDTYTRVRLFSDANQVVASADNSSIESKIGIMQYSESADSKETKAKLQQMAESMLAAKSAAKESFSVSCIGIPEVYSGVALYVNIPYLKLKQSYYVDEDSHEFTGNKHTMQLTLNANADVQGAA